MSSRPFGELEALDRNGMREVAATLSSHSGCLDWLTAVGRVADQVSSVRRTFGVNLLAPTQASVAHVAQRAQALDASGTGRLLRSLPIGADVLRSIATLGAFGAMVMAVRRSLSVDALHANATTVLAGKIKQLMTKGALPATPPRLPLVNVWGLVQLGTAMASIRDGLGVDLLQPGAGPRFADAVQPVASGQAFAPLQSLSLSPPTLGGLHQFTALANGLQLTKEALGIDLLQPQGAASLAQLTQGMQPGGGLHGLSAAVASGTLGASTGVWLPDFQSLSHLSALLASLTLVRRSFGIDALRPDAGAQLQGRLTALPSSGACHTLDGVSVPGPGGEKLGQLASMGADLESARDATGIDLLTTGANDKVAKLVDGFQRHGADTLHSIAVPPEVVAALSHLVRLGGVLMGTS